MTVPDPAPTGGNKSMLSALPKAKLARWLLFGIIFPIVPLIANYLWLGMHEEPQGVAVVIRNGELLLVTSVMCAVALGEIIGTSDKLPTTKILAGGATIIIMMLAIMLFVNISDVRFNNGKISDASIMTRSLITFFSAIFTCTSCVAVSEVK
jgi:amino acid permease